MICKDYEILSAIERNEMNLSELYDKLRVNTKTSFFPKTHISEEVWTEKDLRRKEMIW